MTKLSWRSLIDAKIIKRTDNGMAVLPGAIRIVEGFNWRNMNAPDWREDIDALKAHIKRGGKVPAIEVDLSADGQGVDVVDGHRRTIAYQELIAEGDPIQWIRIEPFTGNEVDRMTRIMTSNEGRKLRPLEIAEGYRRLEAFGLSNDDIARRVGKTRTHVAQLLALAVAPLPIQQMVDAGAIAYGLAIETIRELGPDAAVKKLASAQVDAAATGKHKVTTRTLKPWTPPAKAVAPVVSALDRLHSTLSPETRMQLLNEPAGDAMVSVPAVAIYELLNQHGSIADLRDKAAAKRRESAAKAAQQSIPVADGA